MFGAKNTPPIGGNTFGGIFHQYNKKHLEEYLATLPKSAVYLLYEYDVSMNPYNNGVPTVCIGTAQIPSKAKHVTHVYELRDSNDRPLCTFSYTYAQSLHSSTPDKVQRILH